MRDQAFWKHIQTSWRTRVLDQGFLHVRLGPYDPAGVRSEIAWPHLQSLGFSLEEGWGFAFLASSQVVLLLRVLAHPLRTMVKVQVTLLVSSAWLCAGSCWLRTGTQRGPGPWRRSPGLLLWGLRVMVFLWLQGKHTWPLVRCLSGVPICHLSSWTLAWTVTEERAEPSRSRPAEGQPPSSHREPTPPSGKETAKACNRQKDLFWALMSENPFPPTL